MCVFCDGLGDRPLVYHSDHIVAFETTNPSSHYHLLICPKEHHATMYNNAGLLTEMATVGKELLHKHRPGCAMKLGFHLAPFRSVDHLHMHAIALPHTLDAPQVRDSWRVGACEIEM